MSEENQSPEGGSWKDALPEALRDAPYFKKAETVDQVLADLQGAAAWQGNSLRIPGPDATPDLTVDSSVDLVADDFHGLADRLGLPGGPRS